MNVFEENVYPKLYEFLTKRLSFKWAIIGVENNFHVRTDGVGDIHFIKYGGDPYHVYVDGKDWVFFHQEIEINLVDYEHLMGVVFYVHKMIKVEF